MNNIITVNFKKIPQSYNADIYTQDMCKLQLETVATGVHDACLKVISTSQLNEISLKCVVIYVGLLTDRKDNEDVLLTYFPKKDVCNE